MLSESHLIDDENNRSDDSSNMQRNEPLGSVNSIPIENPTENIDGQPDLTAAPALVAIPSLRGKLLIEGASHVCRGVWALSDLAHETPNLTSDFEFKLIKSNEGSNVYPISGRYQGWFNLKIAKGQVKIEDKEINIRFIAVVGDEGCHRVEGEGSNKFGKFKVYGTLSDHGFLQMYREYIIKEQPPVLAKRKSFTTVSGNSGGGSSSGVPKAPRDPGVARVRKSANLGSNFVTGDRLPGATKSSASSVISAENTARTQRLSQHMLKCGEILKDLFKQPQSLWFGTPVDYVALKLPDYPTIIKEPMDFGTIQKKLDSHYYQSPEAFAEHVRLVFKNAITYNTLRDSPVHVAARDLSNRFEDKYRQLMSQLTATGYGQPAVPEGGLVRAASVASGGGGGGASKKSKSKTSLKRNSSYGPGQMHALPMAMDGGLLELQRKMIEMQNEISHLRAQVRQNEVRAELEQYAKDSHNPLTLEEKQALTQQINRLPAHRMEEVVEMIKSASDVRNDAVDDDQMVINVDDLDTHTLRRLQAYINDVSSKRTYQPDLSYNPKKVKKEVKPKVASSTSGGPTKKNPTNPVPVSSAAALQASSTVHAVPMVAHHYDDDDDDDDDEDVPGLFGDSSHFDVLARHDDAILEDDEFDFDLVQNGDVHMEE